MLVPVGGVELCAHTIGDPADPALLLIGGAAAPMDWWRPAFCARLAARGRHVIRYDHRDTGASTTCPPGAPDYTGADLVTDAAGLIAALAGGRAHVLDISMGGALAQRLALEHADAVASLTLIATSPIEGDHGELPPPRLSGEAPPDPDWDDAESVAAWILAGEAPYAGTLQRDADDLRAVAREIAERSRDVRAAANHWTLDDGPPLRGHLSDIAVPALVVHGTEDPLFPPAHGEALARAIPGARLLLVEGMGHEVPPPTAWDAVAAALP